MAENSLKNLQHDELKQLHQFDLGQAFKVATANMVSFKEKFLNEAAHLSLS